MTSTSLIAKKLVSRSSKKQWVPHRYQQKTMAFMLRQGAALLLLDPGLGKTAISYGVAKVLRQRGLSKKILVIAPLRPCYLVWPKEQEKWEDFKNLRVEVLHGPHKDDALAREADIYVINPEGLRWLFGIHEKRTPSGKVSLVHDMKRVRSLGFDMLIVDEIDMFKNPQSDRSKILKPVLPLFTRRYGLTGDPVGNHLEDLFGETYVVDLGRSFGSYITAFRREYFDSTGFGGFELRPKPGAEERIYEKLKPLAIRMAAEDYLDMPELIERDVWVTLPPKAQKAYDEMEAQLFTAIDQHTVTAASAASASMKCRQIAAGGLYKQLLGETRPALKCEQWIELHNAKTEALREIVDESQGRPILVAYDFHHDLERLQTAFGKTMPHIGGGTTPKRAAELERAWNAGELPLLAGHPLSIGHGLNLQESPCNRVVWYTPTWDRRLYNQLNRRVRRQGSTQKRVHVDRILAFGTIDWAMVQSLLLRGAVQTALFKALSDYKKSR